jgi:hypothetical protein
LTPDRSIYRRLTLQAAHNYNDDATGGRYDDAARRIQAH